MGLSLVRDAIAMREAQAHGLGLPTASPWRAI
jgi:hypothetical protein